MKMKNLTIVMALLLLAVMAAGVSSCKSVKMKDADEKYERGEYNDAANTYRKIYNKLNSREDRDLRGEVAFMLGQCYRHLNQSGRAAAAYQNALRYGYTDSITPFYLAQALQMEGRYKDAIDYYKVYLDTAPQSWQAREGLRACQMAPKWKQEGSRYIVKAAKMFNSRRADFCPMLLDAGGEQIYFASSNEKALGTVKSPITGTKNCDIFFSKKDEKGKWSRPVPVEGELNTEWDEGMPSFTPDGTMMYLARAVRKADAPSSIDIYTSTRSEAKWSASTKFEITADTISAYDDPAVSADGQWLYFSSDMPGGQGGKDLWRVMIKDGHGTLENLGNQINTPGDERFPYSRTDSLLYFASNGHAGFGGLDLFRATLQPSGKWLIENMGAPVNSSGDDFGITFDKTKTEAGFFSSNRKDARGYDHIFSFEKPDLKIWISGYVLDKDEEPVPNAIIRIVGNDGSNQKAVAKPDGTFRFDLQRGVSYVMLAGANGYLNGKQQFTSDLEEEDAEYNVDFILAAMTKPQVIENIFYDFNKATLRPESKAALDSMVMVLNDNPYVTIEMAAHTDRIGSQKYNLGLSERRAKSVVDYLIAHGIDKERLTSKGYGKERPKVVTKRIARLYPQFAEGDTLTEAYIDTLSRENKAAADQINRRTEFQVLTTNYFQTFGDDEEEEEEENAESNENAEAADNTEAAPADENAAAQPQQATTADQPAATPPAAQQQPGKEPPASGNAPAATPPAGGEPPAKSKPQPEPAGKEPQPKSAKPAASRPKPQAAGANEPLTEQI